MAAHEDLKPGAPVMVVYPIIDGETYAAQVVRLSAGAFTAEIDLGTKHGEDHHVLCDRELEDEGITWTRELDDEARAALAAAHALWRHNQ